MLRPPLEEMSSSRRTRQCGRSVGRASELQGTRLRAQSEGWNRLQAPALPRSQRRTEAPIHRTLSRFLLSNLPQSPHSYQQTGSVVRNLKNLLKRATPRGCGEPSMSPVKPSHLPVCVFVHSTFHICGHLQVELSSDRPRHTRSEHEKGRKPFPECRPALSETGHLWISAVVPCRPENDCETDCKRGLETPRKRRSH